jgi:hypothetical protein
MGVRERALLSFLTLDLELGSKQSQLDTANSAGPAGFNRAQSLTSAVDSLQVRVQLHNRLFLLVSC